MKRFFRILGRFGLVLLMVLLSLWLLIQTPFFQDWLVHNAARRLSKNLKTTVRIDHVSFRLLNSLSLEGVFIADRRNDTLLTAGQMQVNITDWFFARDSADLKYIRLKDVEAKLYRDDSVWNYQFLVDYFGPGSKKKDSSTGLALHLKVVDLQNVRIRQFDRWRGKFMIAGVRKLHMEANQISFKNSIYDIRSLVVDKPEYRELKKFGLWSAADSIGYYARSEAKAKADTSKKQASSVVLVIKSLELKNGILEFYNRQRVPSDKGVFDSRDIVIGDLGGTIKDLTMAGDTLQALVDIHAKERSGIDLKRIRTKLRIDPNQMEFARLDLRLNNSRLGDYYAMRYHSMADFDEFIDSVQLTAHLKNSVVSIQDIGFFAPLLKTKNQVVKLTGNANGTISKFFINGLHLETGQSQLTGSYSMVGLTDINKTIINFQTEGSRISLDDVAVWAPELLSLKSTPVGKLGIINYRGTFAGTVFDFAAKGNLETAVGSMAADFKLKMEGPGKGYTGIISNASFDGGKLLDLKDLGKLNFSGTVSSKGFSGSDPLMIKGTIHSGEYAGYTYKNIVADAVISGSKLTAGLSLDDENLAGTFETVLDFEKSGSRYNGRGILRKADLRALGFMKDSLQFSGEFDVDFKGRTIDDFLGYARFYNTHIIAGQTPLSFDSLLLQSEIDSTGVKRLSLHTNEADLTVEGKFNISNLGNGARYFLNRYYPAIITPPKKLVANQDVYFHLVTREVEPFLGLISKRLHGLNYSKINGRLNTTDRELLINADVPFFGYDKIMVSNASIKGSGDNETLNVLASIDNLALNDSISFPNATMRINTIQDTTHFAVNTSTSGPLGEAEIDGMVFSNPHGFEVFFNESSFIINNKKWTINRQGNIAMNHGYFTSTGLTLQQNDQVITLSTEPNGEGNWNDVKLTIKNLNTGDLLPYLLKEPRIEGFATGEVTIVDPSGNMHVQSKLRVDQFRFNNDSIGVVNLSAEYSGRTKRGKAEIESMNEEYNFSGKVALDLNDSATQQINTVLPLRNMRINILQKYLATIFDQLDGYASGDIQVVGKLKSPSLIGRVRLTNGTIKVGYTKCVYKVDTAFIVLGDNYIDFGKLTLKDEKNRTGTVEGRFYHRFFDSLAFDLHLNTRGMQVLNTSGKDNDLFFGKAVASASFDLTGPLTKMYIRMMATPTDSSHIYIANKITKETGAADFVVFKTYGTEMNVQAVEGGASFTMDMDLNANPLAKVDVILDEVSSDVIKAVGNGNIKIHTGTVGETRMRGRYIIQSGSYNYSFQTLFRKPFELSPDDDNYIEWTGDPVNANLNINARYVAKKVSMSTLVNSTSTNTVLDDNARNATGDVWVITKIKGPMAKPDIDFLIELAPGSELSNNLSAKDLINRINNDASERLRQVTYLIVFKSFAPYKEGTFSRNPGTELAVNTISDLVSREMGKILTNVVQQITGDYSLNVDISTNFYNSAETLNGTTTSGTSTYDRVNLGFNLNRAYFNNRVVVNVGSDFDMSVNNTSSTGFMFLPDISVEFILTTNRRLRAIVFKKDNLDIGGRRNRAGASLSYRRDFDKLFGPRDSGDVLFVIGRNETE